MQRFVDIQESFNTPGSNYHKVHRCRRHHRHHRRRRCDNYNTNMIESRSMSVVTVLICMIMLDQQGTDAALCDLRFNSDVLRKGTFMSPGYPSQYPEGITCRYRFFGSPTDRVQIRFIEFDLSYHHDDAKNPFECDDVDLVVVSFSVGLIDRRPFGKYCGSKLPQLMMSTNNTAEVLFFSRSGSSGPGFKAEYAFVSDFGIKVGEQNSSHDCQFTIRSDSSKSGTLTTPNYPGLYPRNIECTFLFRGRPGQRLSLIFTHFDIDGIYPGCLESTQSDFVECYNGLTPSTSSAVKPGRLCNDLPSTQRNVAVRSESHYFTVVFRSNDIYDATGFSAKFEFQTEDSRSEKRHLTSSSSAADSTFLSTNRTAMLIVAASLVLIVL